MAKSFVTARGTLLAATVLGAMLAVALGGAPDARAQFVCVGNPDGAAVPPATASGDGATVGGGFGVACGTGASAGGAGSLNAAFGPNASAFGDNSVNFAAAPNANASGAGSANIGIGNVANASGAGSANIGIGLAANASGDASNNIGMGNLANASGANSAHVAIGLLATAAGDGSNSAAVGAFSSANGLNSSAFGPAAHADFANSAAFGAFATTTRANQQVFGTTTNTYTMPGITSAASASAQSGPTQIVTSDSSGNLATSTAAGLGLATTSQINAINSQLSTLSGAIVDAKREARRGIAATAAMAYAPTPSGPGRTTFAINGSTFEGTAGVGVAIQHRLAGTTLPFYVSGAYGNGGGKEQVGRVGLAVEW